MKRKKSLIPPCPYCDCDTGECEHALINYDRSFGEYLSGYLAKDNPEMRAFEVQIIDLIKQGLKPEFGENDDDFVAIWDLALDYYENGDGSFNLDTDSYLRILEDYYLGEVESISYPEDDSDQEEDDDYEIPSPGYDSACVIIYTKNPPSIIASINNDIINAFKSVE